MQYRTLGKTGKTPSVLGFGMMRLPKTQDGQLDVAWTTRVLRQAIDNGLTYVDTAYVYPDSERVTGIALADGYREKVMLASKLPVGRMNSEEEFDKILNEELERLQTDHIDNYLLHSLNRDKWENKVLPMHLLEHMERAKADGRIRHIGFSFHDDLDVFKTIIDGYDKWEFCQIQLNYLDTNYQAGLEGLAYAKSKGIPVVIMEPLRGGKLANVPESVANLLPSSPVESALDFLWDLDGVNVLLSGMNSEEQVMQNMAYADKARVGMLSDSDRQAIAKASEQMRKVVSIPCTACDYCSVCPQNIAISKVFAIYNQYQTDGNSRKAGQAYKALGDRNGAVCVGCHACVHECPQHIDIPEQLAKLEKAFG